jgi:hypothetical protein
MDRGWQERRKPRRPKGSAIVEGVLYVADITRLRTFNANTGKPEGDIALPGCTFANDVAAGPDGKVYVSDSGIEFDDKGILISITGDTGMVGLAPPNLGEAYINQHIALARPSANVWPAFVARALTAPSLLGRLQRRPTRHQEQPRTRRCPYARHAAPARRAPRSIEQAIPIRSPTVCVGKVLHPPGGSGSCRTRFPDRR